MIKIVPFLLFLLIGCVRENCLTLPETFNSYEEALDLIGRSEFQIHKEISQLNSSWVQKLEYFSCNKTDGFLIMTTNGKRFVHQKVPYSVWEALENSESKGGFYNAVLKKRYSLKINHKK